MCDNRDMTLSEYFISHPDLTQVALAERIGISRSYLAELMSGVKKPAIATIVKVAAATGGAVPPESWFAAPNGAATAARDDAA